MIYFFLGGFALLSCISVAGANVFIVLSTLMGIFRCYLKKDDLTFKNYEGFLKVIIFFLLTMFLSAIFNGEIKIKTDVSKNRSRRSGNYEGWTSAGDGS